MSSLRQFSVLAGSFLAIALLAGSVSAQTLITYYVDSISGNDSYPGSSTRPFKTVNKALQKVHDLGGPTASIDYQVKVKATSGPIAPSDFGGQETFGWLTSAEQASCQRSPFPIRMQDGVDIVGEIGPGGRPVITIVEGLGHTYNLWTDTLSQPGCQTPLQRGMVMAASDARLVDFAINGALLQSSAPASTMGEIPGVFDRRR